MKYYVSPIKILEAIFNCDCDLNYSRYTPSSGLRILSLGLSLKYILHNLNIKICKSVTLYKYNSFLTGDPGSILLLYIKVRIVG